MKDLLELIKTCYSQNLEQKKIWYSPAADAYNKVRPRYSQEMINRVVECAQLSSDAKILEVGCGPGNATVAFARVGLAIACLEPNQDFCRLAQQNCTPYPNVEIRNTSFEEWELEAKKFDAVLAATSIHWIPPEIAYPKAASALKDNGCLILLWNTMLEPSHEVWRILQEVYQTYATSFTWYEGKETQEKHLRNFGEIVVNSGKFKDLIYEQIVCEVTYTIDEYLTLLSTYSPYLRLEPQTRNSLFEALKEKVEKNFEGIIQLSYLSAFHIARKL